MRAKHYLAVLAIATMLIPALWAVVQAAEKLEGSLSQSGLGMEQRDTLRGLQGIDVLVTYLEPAQEQFGVPVAALRTDTVQELWRHGVRVFSESDAKSDATLCVLVNMYGTGDDKQPLLAVSIDVQLRQKRNQGTA